MTIKDLNYTVNSINSENIDLTANNLHVLITRESARSARNSWDLEALVCIEQPHYMHFTHDERMQYHAKCRQNEKRPNGKTIYTGHIQYAALKKAINTYLSHQEVAA